MPRKRLFPPPPPPPGGKRWRNKGRHQRTVLTVNDRIALWRTRWSVPGLGSHTPVDALVDVAEATVSLGVRELACRLAQASSNFDKAAENLARTAQVHLSGEKLRQVVEAEGKAVLKAQQKGQLLPVFQANACRIEPATAEGPATGRTRVYLGSDGVKVPVITQAEKTTRRQKIKEKRRRRGRKCRPLPRAKAGADQKHKECKIVAYYDETQAHRHVLATRGDCQVAGQLMRREACRLAFNQADEKVAVVDGADWIRNQLQRQCLPLDGIGLDFYHLADNVHQTRRTVYGDTDPVGQQWAGHVLHLAKHEGYEALWNSLLDWRKPLRSPKKRQAADRLLGYIAERRTMIAYPEFQAKGWQIGSGPTEALCKTTTARIKRSGMRWDLDNAEAMMALEALDQSGQWKHYWELQLALAA